MATQMIAAEAPLIARLPFNRIERGFVKDRQGRIFFLEPWGRWTLAFPVSSEGKLEDPADTSFNWEPMVFLELVRGEDLGVSMDKHLRPNGMVSATS